MSELIVKMNKVGDRYRPQVSLNGGAVFEDLGKDFSDPGLAERHARSRISHEIGTHHLYRTGMKGSIFVFSFWVVMMLVSSALLGGGENLAEQITVGGLISIVLGLAMAQMAYQDAKGDANRAICVIGF